MKEIARDYYDLKIRQNKQDILIGVLAGGISSEREVSIKTGKNIKDSLERSGYSVIFIDPGQEDFIDKTKKIDIAFLALHGRYGEDGTVQGLLELLKIDLMIGQRWLPSAGQVLSQDHERRQQGPCPLFPD